MLEIPVADSPSALESWARSDVVLLATKSQDTAGALEALRAAGAGEHAGGLRPERRRERADRAAAVRRTSTAPS